MRRWTVKDASPSALIADNETIEDDSGKYLDVVEHIAKDIYEHTDIDDNSDFSATDVACAIMNEATIHYWYWEEPEYQLELGELYPEFPFFYGKSCGDFMKNLWIFHVGL